MNRKLALYLIISSPMLVLYMMAYVGLSIADGRSSIVLAVILGVWGAINVGVAAYLGRKGKQVREERSG